MSHIPRHACHLLLPSLSPLSLFLPPLSLPPPSLSLPFLPPSLSPSLSLTAKITFYQRHQDASSCNLTSSTCWRVEGLASYEYGGFAIQEFGFICRSDQPDPVLSWSLDGGPFTKTQQNGGDGSVIMLFSNPVASDAGIYICRDSANDEEEMLNITHGNNDELLLLF